MKTSEFKDIIEQIKSTSVPRRMVYIWQGRLCDLDGFFKNLEVHRIDIALLESKDSLTEEETTRRIERYLVNMIRRYESKRNEPSIMVIANAILLARYNCELTALLKYGISPRSLVVLVFPKATSASIPNRAERWIKNDTVALVEKIGRQLGDSHCIIDDQGDKE